MRTTVRLSPALLERARREAVRRKTTLTALLEAGLEVVLAQSVSEEVPVRVQLPVCHKGGGTLPGVDLTDTSGLLDILEGR